MPSAPDRTRSAARWARVPGASGERSILGRGSGADAAAAILGSRPRRLRRREQPRGKVPPRGHAAAVIGPSSMPPMVKRKQREPYRKDPPIIARASLPAVSPPERFLDRELSQLAFADRVLAQAAREAVPLAERL